MDPLSITASVITLIGAANVVIRHGSSIKGAKAAITGLLDEMKRLRNTLESVEQMLVAAENSDDNNDDDDRQTTINRERVAALCNVKDGPIALELNHLQEKLRPPDWADQDGSRRRAVVQSLIWPFREADTMRIIEKISRLKKDLQLALTVDQSVKLKHLQKGQSLLGASMKSLHDDQRYWKILRWLDAADAGMNFKAALKTRHENTGLWIFDTPQFQELQSAEASIVWLHGIPGCGKTVLSSTIIEKLSQNQSDRTVVYFYFDFNDRRKQTIDDMLRSLVLQISNSFVSIPDPLIDLFNSCAGGQIPPRTDDLEDLFRTLVASANYYVVLDALDECESREDLLNFLARLMTDKILGLNVIVTSRKLRAIDDFFHQHLADESQISIQNNEVDRDIGSFVQGKLQHDRRLKRWLDRPREQKEIKRRLMDKSAGMFRWAACQIDALSGCLSPKKLYEALDALPATLDETYDRILSRIDSTYEAEVHQILQWLTCAQRPLTLHEVAELIAVDISQDQPFDFDKRTPYAEDVLEICGGLVTCTDPDGNDVDPQDEAKNDKSDNDGSNDDASEGDESDADKDGAENAESDNGDVEDDDDDGEDEDTSHPRTSQSIVRLAHYSVKEYLISKRIRNSSQSKFSVDEGFSNSRIGEVSLACLLLFDKASYASTEIFLRQMPLAKYAAKYWNQHLIRGNEDLPNMAKDLFISSEAFQNWIEIENPDVPRSFSYRTLNKRGSRLYYAVFTRLSKLVQQIVESDKAELLQMLVDNSPGPEIGLGSCRSNMLDKHDLINQSGGNCNSPLEAAAWSGQADIVKLLLEHGADPNAHVKGASSTSLSAAAQNGFINIVTLLLAEGADVHEGLSTDSQDLQQVDEDENYSILRRFVEPVSDAYDQRALRKMQKTALWEATAGGHADIVKLLLERGAGVNVRNGNDGSTALHQAADAGNEAILDLLLAAGAMIDKTDLKGSTPLLYVCMRSEEWGASHGEILRRLLEAGANASKVHPMVGTILRAAAVKGRHQAVSLLLQYGAEVNRFSPLAEALRRGHTDVANTLINNGANVCQMIAYTEGLPLWFLQQPVTSCLVDIVRSITKKGKLFIGPGQTVEADEGQKWVETPLWIAAARGDLESVKNLLDEGADPLFCGKLVTMTALDIAALEEHKDVVDILREAIRLQKMKSPETENNGEFEDAGIDGPAGGGDKFNLRRSPSATPSMDRSSSDPGARSDEEIRSTKHEDGASGNNSPISEGKETRAYSESMIEVLSSLAQRCFIVLEGEEGAISFALTTALIKAKRDSKTITDASGIWKWDEIFPLDTFMARPDLLGLELWWEPDRPLTKEGLEKSGLIPVVTGLPRVKLEDLPYTISKRRDDDGEGE